MKPRHAAMLLLMFATSTLTGCGLIAGVTALTLAGIGVVTVGAVGVTGYAVHKTGEKTADAARAVGNSVSSGASSVKNATSGAFTSVAETIFVRGEFDAKYNRSIDDVWPAAQRALLDMRFTDVRGNHDALSGDLQALTGKSETVKIRFVSKGQAATEAFIRVGVTGNKDASQLIHDRLVQNLEGSPIR